jgi:phosphomannomutase
MAKDKLALTPELDDPSRWEQALRALGGGGHMDATDGLRYDRGESWIHMRRSNTENALRIIAEAGDASAAQAMIEQVKRHLLDT